MSSRRMAVNRLRDRLPVDAAAIDRVVSRHGSPNVEGERATFLFRGEADEVGVRHRVVGLPDPLPMRRLEGTDLWAVENGYVSLTPLRLDLTDQAELERASAAGATAVHEGG